MDSMIRELVGIDRVARERVESVRAWRDEQERAIVQEKDALGANFTEKLELQLAKFTAEAHAERDSAIAELEHENSAALEQLERRFDEHRSEWADALYKLVLQ